MATRHADIVPEALTGAGRCLLVLRLNDQRSSRIAAPSKQ
jgi:hypothetical protein